TTDECDEDDAGDEDRQRVALLRALFLAHDCRVRNPIGATPLRRKLATHRTQDRLDPLVLIRVKEPALDRVDVMWSRRRFRRAAAFLYPHLLDGIPGEDRGFLPTHHIHHR